MPCYSPLSGYRSKVVNPNGRRNIVFNIREGVADEPVDLPCGRCIGCRLERSRQWAIRCVHEASLHSDNCYITLTYNPESLPDGGSLVLEHYQLFMKRLRQWHRRSLRKQKIKWNKKYAIRFFHCGEYGEKFRRPHYHACLFNFDFPDKIEWKKINGHQYYTSPLLEQLWPHGFSTISDVTFDSAAYVARYITKKITGDAAADHYQTVNIKTGEIHELKPEYTTMSRRPGIAADWLKKYSSDVYPADSVVVRGREMKPPKFYDRLFELDDPVLFDEIKRRRELAAKQLEPLGAERLATLEKHKTLTVKGRLKRTYENET